MSSNLSYCGQMVLEHDPDRFLLSMFSPAARREALFALFAFYHEIAKTREVVSETQLGMIRLQWWRDAIADVYEPPAPDSSGGGDVPVHALMGSLAAAIKDYDLPQEEFDALIFAREFDLEDILPGNLAGLLNYADFTATPLLKLAVRICGGDLEIENVQVIAVNYALAGILRAVVSHAKQRRCYLPEDLMRAHSVRVNQLYELRAQDGLVQVVSAVADEFVPKVKAEAPFLRATQALSYIYMRQIKRLGHDLFDPRMQFQPNFKALRVLFGARLG